MQFSKLVIADALLLFIFAGIIFFAAISFSLGNLSHDSVDYYVILQRIVAPGEPSLVLNPFFVEQRSPGYSLLSVPAHYLLSFTGLFVSETVFASGDLLTGGSAPPGSFPQKMLLARDVFFKKIFIPTQQSWLDWRISGALILTSFFFLLLGIIFSVKSLLFMNSKKLTPGIFLVGAIILASPIFMQNIIQTPAYATLCAFGLASLFCYFFIKGYYNPASKKGYIAGLFLGLLALTRLEGLIIFVIVCAMLLFFKDKAFAKKLVIGFLIFIPLFLLYNFFMFGNPLNAAFLSGDLNKILFDPGFIFLSIASPSSGLLFFSPLIILGSLGLFLKRKRPFVVLGVASVLLIVLIAFRVPVSCACVPGEVISIGGQSVICSINACVSLAKSDVNRYVIVLVPFALLGLQNIFFILQRRFKKK